MGLIPWGAAGASSIPPLPPKAITVGTKPPLCRCGAQPHPTNALPFFRVTWPWPPCCEPWVHVHQRRQILTCSRGVGDECKALWTFLSLPTGILEFHFVLAFLLKRNQTQNTALWHVACFQQPRPWDAPPTTAPFSLSLHAKHFQS